MGQGGDLLGAEPASALIDVAAAARRLLSVLLVDSHGLASVAPPVEPFDDQRGVAAEKSNRAPAAVMPACLAAVRAKNSLTA